jgi:very-short-patch-repair endonuclease
MTKQWHPTKNGNLTEEKARQRDKVWWLCPKTCEYGCKHEWESVLFDKDRYGCPYCATPIKRICRHMSIAFTHPEIVKTWHPTRNGNLCPEDFLSGSDARIVWLCPNRCPEGCELAYECKINNRIRYGCPYCCVGAEQVCIHTSLLGKYPEIAKEFHPKNKETADKLTHRSNKKVWWLCEKTCPEGCKHEWEARIANRTGRGDNCPYCSNRKLCEHMSIKYTHPELCREWHTEKNKGINIDTLSFGSDTKVTWICSKNPLHEWITSICQRTSGQGCPSCLNKTEDKLYKYLQSKYNVVRQFKLDSCKRKKHLPFDMCIPELKIIIELDGAQHFRLVRNWGSPEDAVNRDVFKMQHANKEGYKVIRIFQEDVYTRDENWLDEILIPRIEDKEKHNVYISSSPNMYDNHIALLESGRKIEINAPSHECIPNNV